MPISRGQMNRQLYGVGSLVGREKFGIGSKLKKFVRKIIPNEVADVAVKAAPFVAPFNPALGGAMAGLGSFDQTGSISRGVKSGLLNYGLGQGARYLGGAGVQGNPFKEKLFSSPMGSGGIKNLFNKDIGATVSDIPSNEIVKPMVRGEVSVGDMGGYLDPIAKTSVEATTSSAFKESLGKITSGDFTQMGEGLKELGGKGLKAVFTNPVPGSPGETQIDKLAIGATIAGGVSYLDAKRLAKEAELVGDEDEYTEEMYEADKDRYSKYYADIITPAAFGLKEGGRVKYQSGSTPFGIPSITLDEKDEDGIDLEALRKEVEENPTMVNEITDIEFGVGKPGPYTDQGPYPMDDKTQEEKEAEMLYELEQELNSKADGGRIGFKRGSPEDLSDAGIMTIDVEAGDDENEESMKMAAGISFNSAEKSYLFKKLGGAGGASRSYTMPMLYKILSSPGSYPNDARVLKELTIGLGLGKKDGGRIGFKSGDYVGSSNNETMKDEYDSYIKEIEIDGDKPMSFSSFKKMLSEDYADGGRVELAMGSEVPVRKNRGGITELDYRNTGGFVPVGIKEKADDVPAMLSKNEFVMTADAVRGIGNGDVETGAQKLYNIMKQAEKQGIA